MTNSDKVYVIHDGQAKLFNEHGEPDEIKELNGMQGWYLISPGTLYELYEKKELKKEQPKLKIRKRKR